MVFTFLAILVPVEK